MPPPRTALAALLCDADLPSSARPVAAPRVLRLLPGEQGGGEGGSDRRTRQVSARHCIRRATGSQHPCGFSVTHNFLLSELKKKYFCVFLFIA